MNDYPTPQNPEEQAISPQELTRVLDIIDNVGDQVLVAHLVMGACTARHAALDPVEENVVVRSYDTGWERLRKWGELRPVTDDPRRGSNPAKYERASTLSPPLLFKTRTELLEFAIDYQQQQQQAIEEEMLQVRDRIIEQVGEEDTAFLLTFAGTRVCDGEVEYTPVNPRKLKDSERTFVLMDPLMRNYYRANIKKLRNTDPELATYLENTPQEEGTGDPQAIIEMIEIQIRKLGEDE